MSQPEIENKVKKIGLLLTNMKSEDVILAMFGGLIKSGLITEVCLDFMVSHLKRRASEIAKEAAEE